jgi:hypothetical protein
LAGGDVLRNLIRKQESPFRPLEVAELEERVGRELSDLVFRDKRFFATITPVKGLLIFQSQRLLGVSLKNLETRLL